MPTQLQELVLDTADCLSLGVWWAELLGWNATLDVEGDVTVAPPVGEPGLALRLVQVPTVCGASPRVHLDLRSRSLQDQRDLVEGAELAGARRVDVGQGKVPWVVLADPEGNRFCVLEPRPAHARSGALAAVVVQALDPRSQARFWAEATGWAVAGSEPGLATVRAPSEIGPALEFVAVRRLPAGSSRIRLVVRPLSGGDRDVEVKRLVGLGARPLDVERGQAALRSAAEHVARIGLADPEGEVFHVSGK